MQIQLTSQKSNAYVSFCFILTIVYFSSIAYNISIAEDIVELEGDNEQAMERKNRRDVSMSEYVQLKLRDLSNKPWSQVLKSPLVRNYILLFSLLLILLVGLFSYAVYKQYLQLKMKTDIGVL